MEILRMSDIALYNALTKLGLEPNEAKEAVTDIASSKDVATKADVRDLATKTDIVRLETELKYLRWVLLTLNAAILIKLFL